MKPRVVVKQRKTVLVKDVDHGLIGKIPTWARIMHAGNGDRQRLPEPIDRMKGRLILTELNSMKDVEKNRAADQKEKDNTSDPASLDRDEPDCVCIFLHWSNWEIH